MKNSTDLFDPMELFNIFVYGTLKSNVNTLAKRNNKFHHHLKEFINTMKKAYLLEDAYFFDLIDSNYVPQFPALSFEYHPRLKDINKCRIYGEVYKIPNYMLDILANIEGSYFNCVSAEANTYEDGKVVSVLVYEASKEGLLDRLEPSEIREIHCGCY